MTIGSIPRQSCRYFLCSGSVKSFWSDGISGGEDPKLETACRAAWEYAREIEHSDENLDLLEEIFDGSALYTPEEFLPGLI